MELSRVLATDSEMHAVWDRAHFAGVHDYDSWEPELLEDEDIQRHIAAGHFVPINIWSDGAFLIAVRADAAAMPVLSEEESRRALASSEAYRFSSAGHVDVSGIEYVAGDPDPRTVASAPLPGGEYEARVHLLDWDDISEKTGQHPDFIVLLGPVSGEPFRQAVATFERPT